jgi:hypothetical protein
MAANGVTGHDFRQDDAPNKDLSSKFRFKLGPEYLFGRIAAASAYQQVVQGEPRLPGACCREGGAVLRPEHGSDRVLAGNPKSG